MGRQSLLHRLGHHQFGGGCAGGWQGLQGHGQLLKGPHALPSVVGYSREQERLVGQAGPAQLGAENPRNSFANLKRFPWSAWDELEESSLAVPYTDPEANDDRDVPVICPVHGTGICPEELLAHKSWQAWLNDAAPTSASLWRAAVITVSAYFQRCPAARRPGMPVAWRGFPLERILNETHAAARCLRLPNRSDREAGAGFRSWRWHFDVSVLRIANGVFDVKSHQRWTPQWGGKTTGIAQRSSIGSLKLSKQTPCHRPSPRSSGPATPANESG